MAITRTPIIDDDGTGTTGTVIDNAWKTELYNQIDATVTAVPSPTYGTWTPTDISGAALAFTGVSGTWAKVGRLVTFWFELTFPATSNGGGVGIGYLPFTARTAFGCAQGYGVARTWYGPVNAAYIAALDPVGGGGLTNAQLSGSHIIVNGTYLTD